ncbi:Tetratricopeptide TPR_2 repeat protein [Anaeromyxobacter sp. Fw109-5]|nr:Tetratricopeptide TPR_2 repeat protein [Anaeromyxobacter sp. Fw109-5]
MTRGSVRWRRDLARRHATAGRTFAPRAPLCNDAGAVNDEIEKSQGWTAGGGTLGGEPFADGGSDWAHRYPLAVVWLLALLAYSSSFTGAFVFDDLHHVRDNLAIRDLGAFLSWSGYELAPQRYVGYVTFAVNYALGKLNPLDYHVVNFLIHAINAGLVYGLVLLCFRTPRLCGSAVAGSAQAIAFFAAAVFATHPVQTQAVTYVVQRFTSLATLFYLLTVVLFLRWRLARERGDASRTKHVALYAGVLASAVLAMKTKEIAFTAPIAVVLCELSFFGPSSWRRRLFLVPIAATILIIPFTMLGPALTSPAAIAQATRVQTTLSRLDYLLTQAPVIATYLRLLVWPAGQNLDHDFPLAHALLEPRVLAATLLLAALASVAALLYRHTSARADGRPLDPAARLAGFGIAWFFLALAVESTLVPIVDVIYEHRVYLPSVGLFCGAGVLVALGLHRLQPRHAARGLVVGAAVVAVVLGAATFKRNRAWASELSIWSDAAEKSPNKSRPHLNLGTVLVQAGRLEDGSVALRRAVECDPASFYARAQLGAALLSLGRMGEAEGELREAVRLAPRDPEALFNLAMVLLRTGRKGEARPHLTRFLEVAPASYSSARSLAERAVR